jgi:hypothetical protein
MKHHLQFSLRYMPHDKIYAKKHINLLMIQNEISKHQYTTSTYKDRQEKGHVPNNHFAYIHNMSSFLKNKNLAKMINTNTFATSVCLVLVHLNCFKNTI